MNFELIKKLREKIPIGISDAIKTLTENNFDVDKSAKHWEEITVKSFIEFAKTSENNAVLYLEKYEWDLQTSIQKFQDDQLTAVEKILKYTKSKETAVSHIADLISAETSWLREGDNNYYLHLREPNQELIKGKPAQSKFYLLYFFEIYLDYEGYNHLPFSYVFQVIEFLKELGMPELAKSIADDVKAIQSRPRLELKGEKFYMGQKEMMFAKMIEYVIAHKSEFPK
jgi:hypothetical protein